MHGIHLTKMEVSDMVDVLHYFFEEDFTYSSEEQVQSQSKSRESIYGNLYGREYKYKYEDKKNTSNRAYVPKAEDDDFADDALPQPFDPLAQKTKDYIPPTQFDQTGMPIGDVLDAPLG